MQRLLPLFVILLIGWLAGGTWFWVCKVRGLCDGDAVAATSVSSPTLDTPAPPDITFAAEYDGQPLFDTPDPIRFGRNSALGRMTPGATTMLDQLLAWLDQNPDKDLEITGRFAAEEPSPDGSLNMGLARVDFLKKWLNAKGLDPARILSTYAQLPDSVGFNDADTLIQGIRLRVLDRVSLASEGGADDGAVASPQIDIAPRIVYFDNNSDFIPLDDELREYLSQAIQYLRQHADNTLSLTGHTDNMGPAANNKVLGLNRANKVKEMLVALGLNEAQISVSSEGEERPVAGNDTEAGRAKNRRVEIQLK